MYTLVHGYTEGTLTIFKATTLRILLIKSTISYLPKSISGTVTLIAPFRILGLQKIANLCSSVCRDFAILCTFMFLV